jgi:hypothetical protein
MLYKFGRMLQLLGLLLLPVAIAGNVAREDQINLKVSLTISAVGVVIFLLGWLLLKTGRPR